MANSLCTPVLTGIASPTSQARFTNTNSSLDVNGFLVDIWFTVPEDYAGKWDFLNDWYLNISYRVGTGNGTQLALVSNVSLYDLLSYSDYIAGVSMSGTDFTAGKEARISGFIDAGFFKMGSRDALDVSLSLASLPTITTGVNFAVSAVFNRVQGNVLYTYSSAKPTGSDSPFTNVLEIYYVGNDQRLNDNAVIRDQIGTKTVNVEDAIALSNAVGRFEFFTRFGQIWSDTYGLSQDISMRVPNTVGGSIFIKRMEFNVDLLVNNADETLAEREALVATIRATDSSKYEYLRQLGVVD